MRITKHWETVM